MRYEPELDEGERQKQGEEIKETKTKASYSHPFKCDYI